MNGADPITDERGSRTRSLYEAPRELDAASCRRWPARDALLAGSRLSPIAAYYALSEPSSAVSVARFPDHGAYRSDSACHRFIAPNPKTFPIALDQNPATLWKISRPKRRRRGTRERSGFSRRSRSVASDSGKEAGRCSRQDQRDSHQRPNHSANRQWQWAEP